MNRLPSKDWRRRSLSGRATERSSIRSVYIRRLMLKSLTFTTLASALSLPSIVSSSTLL